MIRSPEILKVLQTAPLFQGVSGKLLIEKLSEARLRTLNSGEALLVPGQANNAIYIILAGRLSIQVLQIISYETKFETYSPPCRADEPQALSAE